MSGERRSGELGESRNARYWDTVCALVVAYAPDLKRLEENLRLLRAECAVVIVDNSEHPETQQALCDLAARVGAHHIPMAGNKGIAAAQNRGLAWIAERGSTYALLFDDDSRPCRDLVARLVATDEALRARGEPVGAVSARAVGADGVHITAGARSAGGVSETRDMMSSGSLIRTDVIRTVGGMEEPLFIDCVDFEWGWRARARGLKLFLADVAIGHSLGFGHRSVLGFRVGVPSPIRHYYQYRNILWMMGRGYAPIGWRARQLVALAAKPLFFVVFVGPRLRRLAYMARGIRDALVGRGGAFLRGRTGGR